jgi:hypothetical protein
MLPPEICPEIWKDIKRLQKKVKRPEIFPDGTVSPEDEIAYFLSHPYLKAIVTTLQNKLSVGELQQIADKYARQPYLSNGWVIWKYRYAIDKRGKSNGTRTIFLVQESSMLISFIYLKNDGDDERAVEAEFKSRVENYLNI